jgi:hypothetical protein
LLLSERKNYVFIPKAGPKARNSRICAHVHVGRAWIDVPGTALQNSDRERRRARLGNYLLAIRGAAVTHKIQLEGAGVGAIPHSGKRHLADSVFGVEGQAWGGRPHPVKLCVRSHRRVRCDKVLWTAARPGSPFQSFGVGWRLAHEDHATTHHELTFKSQRQSGAGQLRPGMRVQCWAVSR